VGLSKGGFMPTHFSSRNSLQSAMYSLHDTVVLIAARSRKNKT
jgi:hypothetical protein